ncbi:MAG: GNAT family N-acetyltransferase [Halocynthiibacter sp.]
MRQIRAARPSDATEVAAILLGRMRDTPWLPRLYTSSDTYGFAEMMIARGWVTVARAPRVEGFLALEDGFVHALYVKKPGLGTGRALLENAKASCRQLTLWVFQENIQARHFYTREGFYEVERTDGAENDENLPDIRYEWRREGKFDEV